MGYERLELQIKLPLKDSLEVLMKEQSINLNQLVVSASKNAQNLSDVAVSMDILKPKTLEKTNAVKLDDGLDQVSGVNMINGQLNIRGGSGFSYGVGSRVTVLVDDMPMLSGDAGDVKFDFIPTENIEQIEIIKGASSALFGSGALGGVVNVRTARATNKPVIKFKTWSGVFDHPSDTSQLWWSNPRFQSGASGFYSKKFGNTEFSSGLFYYKDEGYRKGETTENSRFSAMVKHHFKKIPGFTIGANMILYHTNGGNFLFWDSPTHALLPRPGTLSVYNNYRSSFDPIIQYVKPNGTKQKLMGRLFQTNNNNATNGSTKALVSYFEYQLQKPRRGCGTGVLRALPAAP
jgi:iron complex outermembrane receptor protein